MAFPSVSGYGNLPNGNFSPVIYSKKAQLAFRKTSVVQAITNTDYFGEIADAGDTVKIIQEPDITVAPYKRGTQVVAQDLDDEELVLVVDQANYFAFKVEDIEKKHSHVAFESLAANRAGWRLKDAMDSEVLGHITTRIPSVHLFGDASTPLVVRNSPTSGQVSPIQVLNRLGRLLDQQDVPEDGRWFVADPVFWELMRDENSKLLNQEYAQDNSQILRNGKVTRGKVYGFDLYNSRNLPIVGTGPDAPSGGTNGGWVIAGHISAVATAENLTKNESYRDPDSFADVVRGLHVYGRKVLRTEALVGSVYRMAQ